MITSEYPDYYIFYENGEILTKKPSQTISVKDMRYLIENDYFEKRVRIKTHYITGKTESFYAYQCPLYEDIVYLIYNNAVYTLFKPFYEIIEKTEEEIF